MSAIFGSEFNTGVVAVLLRLTASKCLLWYK